MSSKRGECQRKRPQRHQNSTVFKNDLHDNSERTKKLNAMSINEVVSKNRPATQPDRILFFIYFYVLVPEVSRCYWMEDKISQVQGAQSTESLHTMQSAWSEESLSCSVQKLCNGTQAVRQVHEVSDWCWNHSSWADREREIDDGHRDEAAYRDSAGKEKKNFHAVHEGQEKKES